MNKDTDTTWMDISTLVFMLLETRMALSRAYIRSSADADKPAQRI